MKLTKLYFYDDKNKWKLEPVEFLPNINLLVGVSGVGKTRILRAIDSLKDIVNGASLNGVEWNVCFTSSDNIEYSWSGKFEVKESMNLGIYNLESEEKYNILREEVICNNKIVISRSLDEIRLNDIKTPVELLKQEDVVAPITKEIHKINLVNLNSNNFIFFLNIASRHQNISLSELREIDLPIGMKLSILYEELPDKFEIIKASFLSIFPNVLDIKIDKITKEHDLASLPKNITDFLGGVKIKEKKVEGWLDNASSGMIKTLLYIGELYLSPEHSVILIDEFENSLGINCLDSVTELILNDRESQFIITSHHPYIINNVSPAYWRIVTRQGSSVTVKSAKDFHISDSRQKAFIDLINVLEDEEESDE